jgi:biotin---protein ligase
VDKLAADEQPRSQFLKACLNKLHLEVNEEEQAVPSLSRIHLSSHQPSDTAELVADWSEIITMINGKEYIKGENDILYLEKQGTRLFTNSEEAFDTAKAAISQLLDKEQNKSRDDIHENNNILKIIVIHEENAPKYQETPHFDHDSYFSHLSRYRESAEENDGVFGKHIMYGEVVTSTNTLLEKNPSLLRHLPTGLTFTATTQIAGRGRGSNTWIAPPGALMFSTVFTHPIALTSSAPVVFVQYLAGLATVVAVQTYESRYSEMRVKLKWPNDIYALHPESTSQDQKEYVKIGGILVNSSYSGSDYTLVLGIGLNVANPSPTTTLNAVAAKQNLPAFRIEKLLAKILVSFEDIYRRFCRTGWDRYLETMYYANWLHSGQIVTVESAGGVKAKITGITKDWGLLIAEELGRDGTVTGRKVQLQSDSNSFDFFKGLLLKKL